jgi:hypothetical protein
MNGFILFNQTSDVTIWSKIKDGNILVLSCLRIKHALRVVDGMYKLKEILYSTIDTIISFYFSRDPNVHYLDRVYQ